LTLNAALDVLPIASTATLCHVFTRWCTAILAGLNDGEKLTTAKVGLLLGEFDLDQFAFKDVRHEHYATIVHAG
jgi:hypothetical protein